VKYRGPLAIVATLASSVAVGEVVDFEAVNTNAPLQGWTFTKTDVGDPPRWAIEIDKTSPMQPQVLAQLSEDRTSGRFCLAIYEGAETVDGELAVRFKPVSGSVDKAAGLVWRYRDENNYYVLRANALEGNVVLYKVENGRRIPLGPVGRSNDYGVKHPVPAQQWSTLGVVFDSDKFTVSFDEKPLFEVVDATFTEAGKVGLWTKADSVTYFDGFEIQER
jgi:hypothetical protein